MLPRHGGKGEGSLEITVNRARFDALAAFFHRIVGQADHVKVGHFRRTHIDLDFDAIRADCIDRGAVGFKSIVVASGRS